MYQYQPCSQQQDFHRGPVETESAMWKHAGQNINDTPALTDLVSMHASDVPLKQNNYVATEQEIVRKAAPDQAGEWHPGVFTAFPWLAVFAVLGALICEINSPVHCYMLLNRHAGTGMSFAVLIRSDGMKLDSWEPFTPSICVAALSVIANTLIGYALVEALTIMFWRRMLKGGKVRQFRYGTSHH